MSKILRNQFVLVAATGLVALAMSAVPVQLGSTGSLFDLKAAQADPSPGNSGPGNSGPGNSGPGASGGEGSGEGSPGQSGPGNS